MRRLRYIVQKEFIQIFRNKAILPIIFIAPIVQLIVLSFAADNEVKNVNLAIVNQDHSEYARRVVQKIEVADRFILYDVPLAYDHADQLMQAGEVDIILVIPPRFEKSVLMKQPTAIQLMVNAINGQQATVGASYLMAIIQSFNGEVMVESMQFTGDKFVLPISTEESYWYNEKLEYQHFMVPGIMGELVTILIMLLTAMNIVREREIGTIEQINVTPIRKWEFILGKMLPFLIIGLVLLTIGLTVGKIIFDVPIRGSLLVVFAYCVVNIIAVLGLGLFISNISSTQQQAMFTTFFFVIIFILMSGLFTPIESMPELAQKMTLPNPVAHFVAVMRSVLLKGSGFGEVAFQFQITAVLAVLFNGLAILSYRKVA